MMSSRVLLLGGLASTAAYAVHQRNSRRAVERLAAATLETLLNAIDANDEQTGMHVRRVAAHSLIIADAAGLSEREQREIERVALFHDIGKIHEALFDIVHDASRLTAKERQAIATHPMRGAQVLAPLAAFFPRLPAAVAAHHERWDGGGYPRGLRGEQIPFAARIVAIADTFDAITHDRHYRRSQGVQAAIDVLVEERGRQFDPDLIDLVMLPPVLDRMTRLRLTRRSLRHDRDDVMPRFAADVADIDFRWRAESTRADGVNAARDVD
jgi:putative two-component system response regulator